MSINQFSNQLYMQPLTDGETMKVGSFQVQSNMELTHIRTLLYFNNLIPVNQQIRFKVYADSLYSDLLYTSSWALLSQVPCTSNWLGYVRIDFAGENLNKNLTYYVLCETQNYTYSVSSYLALTYDFPFPVYDNTLPAFTDHPFVMQIFGKS